MLVGDVRQSMLFLLAAVLVVLATALANLVSLALVRANDRRAELAMRIALGASRWHLARQLIVEALLLVVTGSVLGWMVALQATAAGMIWAPASIPRLGEVSPDGRVALFAFAVTVVVTVLLAAAPLGAIAHSAGDALRSANRGRHRRSMEPSRSECHGRVRNRGGTRPGAIDDRSCSEPDQPPGRAPRVRTGWRLPGAHIYTTGVSIARRRVAFLRAAVRSAHRRPGVTRVGVISVAPLSGLLVTVPFSVDGQPSVERTARARTSRDLPRLHVNGGHTIAAGAIVSGDRPSKHTTCGAGQRWLADRFLSGGAIGQRLLIDDNNEGPRPVEIVGVVENVRHTALDLPPAFDVYVPLRQIHPDGVPLLRSNQFWMVQAASDPAAFRATFLTHLRAVDPDAAVSGTGAMREYSTPGSALGASILDCSARSR